MVLHNTLVLDCGSLLNLFEYSFEKINCFENFIDCEPNFLNKEMHQLGALNKLAAIAEQATSQDMGPKLLKKMKKVGNKIQKWFFMSSKMRIKF